MIFKAKYFSFYVLLTDHVSLPDCLYFLKKAYNMFIVIVWVPACDVTNFEIYISFLIKPFFYITKKVWKKIKYVKNEKNF